MTYRLTVEDLERLRDVVQAHRDEQAADVLRNELVTAAEHAAMGPIAEGELSRFAEAVDM